MSPATRERRPAGNGTALENLNLSTIHDKHRLGVTQAQRPGRGGRARPRMSATAENPRLLAALDYARRGWPVFPVTVGKVPLTEHGKNDASTNPAVIRGWWKRRPDALASIVTGAPSRIVALDVDIRDAGSGLDSLEELRIAFHPMTPTAHTPSGGLHLLFAYPGYRVPSSAGKLGRFLDVRGDSGSLILPPGPGRSWDPHLGLDTPLAPMPEWMALKEAPAPRRVCQERPAGKLSRYGEAALDSAVGRILAAPAGEQETTLNSECYAIGQLSAGGVIPARLALDSLAWAAHKIPSHDRRRPWRASEIERRVKDAFADGLREPRRAPDARR